MDSSLSLSLSILSSHPDPLSSLSLKFIGFNITRLSKSHINHIFFLRGFELVNNCLSEELSNITTSIKGEQKRPHYMYKAFSRVSSECERYLASRRPLKECFLNTLYYNLFSFRFVCNPGLGFKTPNEARIGNYIDKKCPFTGKVKR